MDGLVVVVEVACGAEAIVEVGAATDAADTVDVVATTAADEAGDAGEAADEVAVDAFADDVVAAAGHCSLQ